MNANNSSLIQAQNYMMEHFFKGNENTFGKYSYSNYLKAIKELS